MKIGFDLWGTLIRSNPLFQVAKRTLWQQHFPQISSELFLEAQRKVKSDLDKLTELTGYQSDSSTRRNLLIHYLGQNINDSDLQRMLSRFLTDYENLFKLFPPLSWSDETLEFYEKISKEEKNKIIIVSNTVFTSHSSLKPVIDPVFYYDEFVTSDVMRISKPSKGIWDNKLDYFIGDNPTTDGGYAKAIGAEFIQINTNNKTIKDAYDHIKSVTN